MLPRSMQISANTKPGMHARNAFDSIYTAKSVPSAMNCVTIRYKWRKERDEQVYELIIGIQEGDGRIKRDHKEDAVCVYKANSCWDRVTCCRRL